MIPRKILLIDFCETIVSIQTADDFIFFVLKENKIKFLLLKSLKRFLNIKIVSFILSRLAIKVNFKKISAFFLKGISESVLNIKGDLYANLVLTKLINKEVISKIKNEYNNEQKIIVSGGYDYYIKHIMMSQGISIDTYLCSKLEKNKKNILTGKIEFDCMEMNKLIALNRIGISPSPNNDLITFTDSISDLPLIKISNKTYFIHENNIRYSISKI